MPEPSDHLLRTLAAVPVTSRVLDVDCGAGTRAEALILLGFDVYAVDASPENVEDARAAAAVHVGEEEATRRISRARVDALGYPDEFFDWVVACGSLAHLESRDAMLDALRELRRVMRSGAWLYVTVPAVPERAADLAGHGYAGDSGLKPTFLPRTLKELMEAAEFAQAEGPALVTEADSGRIVQGIYRRVDEGTPG